VLPEPNFPVRPDEFVGRQRQIEIFCQALQQGLQAGRTESFAILGDWGIGKSSLLLKFAALCSQSSFAILPVFISASSDVQGRHSQQRISEFVEQVFGESQVIAKPVCGSSFEIGGSRGSIWAVSAWNVNRRACF
jgi:ABC-type branched-subunit amino acid transport system ATPase component